MLTILLDDDMAETMLKLAREGMEHASQEAVYWKAEAARLDKVINALSGSAAEHREATQSNDHQQFKFEELPIFAYDGLPVVKMGKSTVHRDGDKLRISREGYAAGTDIRADMNDMIFLQSNPKLQKEAISHLSQNKKVLMRRFLKEIDFSKLPETESNKEEQKEDNSVRVRLFKEAEEFETTGKLVGNTGKSQVFEDNGRIAIRRTGHTGIVFATREEIERIKRLDRKAFLETTKQLSPQKYTILHKYIEELKEAPESQ